MTREETINYCRYVAESGCGVSADEHKQLAEWLEDLKKAYMYMDEINALIAEINKHTDDKQESILNSPFMTLQKAKEMTVAIMMDKCSDCSASMASCNGCDIKQYAETVTRGLTAASEIVHCKDCVSYDQYKYKYVGIGHCKYCDIVTRDNGYCHNGRKGK